MRFLAVPAAQKIMNAAKSAATIVLPTGVPATMETKRPATEQTTLRTPEQIVTDKKLLKSLIALRAGKIISALIKRLPTKFIAKTMMTAIMTASKRL